MSINILFINAIDVRKSQERIFAPLGLGYLASSIRKNFGNEMFNIKIINHDIENEYRSFKPDIVGISSVSQNFNRALEYGAFFHSKGVPVIYGGTHISTLPTSLPDNAVLGVIGEGEITICEILDNFLQKDGFSTRNFSNIKGIAYHENGKITLTPKRDLIQPLDQIPFPARDLLNISTSTYMFTSRGCPYKCVFCASTRFWDKVRLFTAEYVVEEIKMLVSEYHVTQITFYDDLFIVSKERVKRIINLLEANNLLGKIKFFCSARADLIDDEIVKLLKKLGVQAVAMGLESGSKRTLDYLKMHTTTVQENSDAIDRIKSFHMHCSASFIFGAPEETKAEVLETLRFIRHSKLDDFDFYLLTPYPGTPIWEYALQKSLVNNQSMNWDILDVTFHNIKNAIILSGVLSRKELLELAQQFQREKIRKRIMPLLKKALFQPWKIPRYLFRLLIHYKTSKHDN